MVQVGCVDVGVSDVKGRPIRLRQSEVCLGQGDGSIPSRPVFATPAWRRPASVSETRGPRTSRRRATASGLGSRGGGRRVRHTRRRTRPGSRATCGRLRGRVWRTTDNKRQRPRRSASPEVLGNRRHQHPAVGVRGRPSERSGGRSWGGGWVEPRVGRVSDACCSRPPASPSSRLPRRPFPSLQLVSTQTWLLGTIPRS